MTCDTCAMCCSVFSAVGFVFLTSIGILIAVQPLYIDDLTVSDSKSCFIAATMYAIVALVCIVHLRRSSSRQRSASVDIRDFDDDPKAYSKMKLGVRYGSVDTKEK